MQASACMMALVSLTTSGVAAADETAPRKMVAAIRIEQPPVLDGRLDDVAWQQAAVIEDLHPVVSDE